MLVRQMVLKEKLNPLSLNWRRFWVAVSQKGRVVGCVQVKPHGDGTRELASLVVLPEWRGRGVARSLIHTALEHESGAVYLTCRSGLQKLYERFGFHALSDTQLPPYFRRLRAVFRVVRRVSRLKEDLAVMRWDRQLSTEV